MGGSSEGLPRQPDSASKAGTHNTSDPGVGLGRSTNPTGKVTKATLIKKLGHGLDELALKRARALTFTPAKDDADRPVASIVVWEFTFTLPR